MCPNHGMFIAFIVALLLGACASTTTAPHEQQFQGVILKDKKPAAGARVRLVTTAADDCRAKGGLETETDKRGHFQLSRVNKGDGDAARPYQLCVLSDDTWETLWSETRAPAPRSVEFECDLTDKYKDKCWVSWDREGLKRGSWSR